METLPPPTLSRLSPNFRTQITQFCHTWHITELSLFGSILRDDFRPDSHGEATPCTQRCRKQLLQPLTRTIT